MFNITKFKEAALSMWLQKCKVQFGKDYVERDGDIIRHLGVRPHVLIEFTNDGVEFTTYHRTTKVPYVNDELTFIRNIQKEAKKEEFKPLKNLKALRDNIKLVDFEEMRQYEYIFKSYKAFSLRIRKDEEFVKLSGLNPFFEEDLQKRIGQEVYTFAFDDIWKVSNPVVKVTVGKVRQATGWVFDTPEDETYWAGLAFDNPDDAIIMALFFKYIRYASSYIYNENARETKEQKVAFIDNMKSFLKFKERYPKEIAALDQTVKNIKYNHPELFL